jgi:hypothetical protein
MMRRMNVSTEWIEVDEANKHQKGTCKKEKGTKGISRLNAPLDDKRVLLLFSFPCATCDENSTEE